MRCSGTDSVALLTDFPAELEEDLAEMERRDELQLDLEAIQVTVVCACLDDHCSHRCVRLPSCLNVHLILLIDPHSDLAPLVLTRTDGSGRASYCLSSEERKRRPTQKARTKTLRS